MSATKKFIETNCYYDEDTNKFEFIDGYEESAPKHIIQQRLRNAGLDKNLSSNQVFKYNCSDLNRHKFYQKLHSKETVAIDERWYNTYLEMIQSSNWLCVVKWSDNDSIKERLVDFVLIINKDKIAFWFNEDEKQYYCRQGIELVPTI